MTTPSAAILAGQHANEVDGQHHLQLELLQAYGNAVETEMEPQQVTELFDRLIDFSKMHFSAEEVLMRLYSYDRYQAHMAEHDAILERMQALRPPGGGSAQKAALGDLARETGDALLRHIRSSDRAFSAHLATVGVAQQHQDNGRS